MPNDRMSQINELIKREVAVEIHNIYPDFFVSVTQVLVSKDISYAKIWISTPDDSEAVLSKLKAKSKEILKSIAKKTVLKKVPSLHFVLDKTEGSADKIDHLIDEMMEKGDI